MCYVFNRPRSLLSGGYPLVCQGSIAYTPNSASACDRIPPTTDQDPYKKPHEWTIHTSSTNSYSRTMSKLSKTLAFLLCLTLTTSHSSLLTSPCLPNTQPTSTLSAPPPSPVDLGLSLPISITQNPSLDRPSIQHHLHLVPWLGLCFVLINVARLVGLFCATTSVKTVLVALDALDILLSSLLLVISRTTPSVNTFWSRLDGMLDSSTSVSFSWLAIRHRILTNHFFPLPQANEPSPLDFYSTFTHRVGEVYVLDYDDWNSVGFSLLSSFLPILTKAFIIGV